VPDDVKAALASLRLRGVYQARRGPVAMIGFNDPNKRGASEPYREGESFEDPKHPQSEWRVEAIDVDRARVILARGDAIVSLSLYPHSARTGASAGDAGVPAIISASESAVEDALRNAGIEADVIRKVMAGVRDPASAEAVRAAEELRKIAEAAGDAEHRARADDEDRAAVPRRRAPPRMPGGMEELFRQMAEQTAETRSRDDEGSERREPPDPD